MIDDNLNRELLDIVSFFNADMGTIHLINEQGNYLILATHNGLPEQIIAGIKQIPLEKESIAPLTFRKRKPVVIGNLTIDPAKYIVPSERTLGIGGMVSVPIFLDNEPIGVLGIGCFKERKFSEQEVENLIQKAKQIAKKHAASEKGT